MNENLHDIYRSTPAGVFSISGDINSTVSSRSVFKTQTDGVFLIVATITTPLGVSSIATTEHRRTAHERPIICRVTDENGTILDARVQPSSATLKLPKDHAATHAMTGAACKGIDGYITQFTTANEMQVWFVVELKITEVLVMFCDSRPDTAFTTEVFRIAKTFHSSGVPEV